MTKEPELAACLDRVCELLITPSASAMKECQTVLESAVEMVRRDPDLSSSRVTRVLRNIRFLLEQAAAFWSGRPVAATPGLQYSSRGSLVPPQKPSTFALEV